MSTLEAIEQEPQYLESQGISRPAAARLRELIREEREAHIDRNSELAEKLAYSNRQLESWRARCEAARAALEGRKQ